MANISPTGAKCCEERMNDFWIKARQETEHRFPDLGLIDVLRLREKN
jgi:hypothetical protein